jgi:uncharacterized membrane protein
VRLARFSIERATAILRRPRAQGQRVSARDRGRLRPCEVRLAIALADINDRDEVVSAYTGVDGKAHGFVRSAGRFTRIGVPRAVETVAFGVNDLGEVAGTSVDAAGLPHGFWRDRRGHVTTVDLPGVLATAVFDINDQGVMVGTAFTSPTTSHGFLRDPHGEVTTFAVPTAPSTTGATGINDHGQIVGQYTTPDGTTHGFLRDRRGQITTIDVPGAGPFTSPFHINDRNQVVGTYRPRGAAPPAPTASPPPTARCHGDELRPHTRKPPERCR